MANLLDFFFNQLVVESDMDTLQSNLEQADLKLMLDPEKIGVISGFAVAEHSPTPDLTVDIAGPGTAYDQDGRRVFMPASVNLDVSTDSGGSPTAVVGSGDEKYVSVYIQFERVPSDLQTDGNGNPVNFRQDEGISFVVIQGADATAGTAVRPGLLSDALLISDILLAFGDTQIFDAAIESRDVVTKPNSRFEFMFNLTGGSPVKVRDGPLPDTLQAILDGVNTHLTGASNKHDAADITFDDSGVDITGTDVDAALVDLSDNWGKLSRSQTWTNVNTFNATHFHKGQIDTATDSSGGKVTKVMKLNTHQGVQSAKYDSDRSVTLTFSHQDSSAGTSGNFNFFDIANGGVYLVESSILAVLEGDHTKTYHETQIVKVENRVGFSATILGTVRSIDTESSGGLVFDAEVKVTGSADSLNLAWNKATGDHMNITIICRVTSLEANI